MRANADNEEWQSNTDGEEWTYDCGSQHGRPPIAA